MWAPFNPSTGLSIETAFPYMSETGSFTSGFLYPADPLRVYTNTFYHLSYLLGEAFGIGGSYFPYQLVYAALWWGRGFLVFLLVRKFDPTAVVLSYVSGALAVVHASDKALQWIGQMNQFGVIVWMLVSFYLLLAAATAERRGPLVMLTLSALLCEYLSLWSYEGQIVLLLVFPLVLFASGRLRGRRARITAALWYSVPLIYVLLTLVKYRTSGGLTYQETVVRKGFALRDLFADLLFNVSASFEFWRWPGIEQQQYDLNNWVWALPPVGAALIFITGGLIISRYSGDERRRWLVESSAATWWSALAIGVLALVASFPVYVLLSSARELWRTQFLSGVGAALTWTAALGLVCAAPPFVPRIWRVAGILIASSFIVAAGTHTAIGDGESAHVTWERHRAAVWAILRAAPKVKPDTVVVLVNVPRTADPFGNALWMDLAARLMYPGVPVAGTYFYEDGSPAPGSSLEANGGRWSWVGHGSQPIVRAAPIANTVIVDFKQQGADGPLKAMPAFVCHTPCEVETYNPSAVITGAISARTARRYQLPPGFLVGAGGIKVRAATYGQSCYGVALPHGMENRVYRGNATRLMDAACSGQDSCDFKVSAGLFGDPASYCGKDFRVRWTCPDGRSHELTTPAEAVDTTIHLQCASDGAGHAG
jgi:hypothetical protein